MKKSLEKLESKSLGVEDEQEVPSTRMEQIVGDSLDSVRFFLGGEREISQQKRDDNGL